MKQIYANNQTLLQLGRQGENLARKVVFDLSAWEAEYGHGVAELIHQRPGDAAPYPVAAVREGNTLVWTLTATDTAVASSYGSNGHCELRYYVGDVLAKSATWPTKVIPAMDTPSETAPPEPEQGWVDQIIAVGSAAKKSADAAKAQADAAAQSAAGAAQSAQEAAESAAVYDTVVADVTQLKQDLADNAEADADTRRKLDYLWKLNQGISYQFETDDTESYQKTVSSGAKLASVEVIGGKTIAWNTAYKYYNLSSSTKNGIAYEVKDGIFFATGTATETTFLNVGLNPFSFIEGNKYYLSGSGGSGSNTWYSYFSAYDSPTGINLVTNKDMIVDCTVSKKTTMIVYINSGVTVDIKYPIVAVNLTAMFGSGNEPTSTKDPRIAWIKQYAAEHPEYNAADLVSAEVESVVTNQSIYAIPEAVRTLPGYGWSVGDVYNSIERTETGWQYVQRVGSRDYQEGDTVTDGATTYYALDNPVITDITDLMNGTLDAIPVEPGGTLTFENAAKLPVPNRVEYVVSLAEVNG